MFGFNSEKNQAYDISWATIVKLAVAFFAFYIIYLVRDVLLWVIFGLTISVLFDPAIDFLQRFRLSRPVATIFVYVSIFGLIGFLIYLIAPILIIEVREFSRLFPIYFEKIAPFLSSIGFDIFQSMDSFVAAVQDWLAGAQFSVFRPIAAVLNGIFLALTVFAIALFFSLEEKGIEKLIRLASPSKHKEKVLEIWRQSKIKISGWFAARLLTMIAVGIMTSIACLALGIRYPIIFGFIAGVLDIIPFIGPLTAGALIALFALLTSWQMAAAILVVFMFIHLIDGNLLTPLLAKKFLKLPAILILISILIGEKLWGPVGAVLAIPLFGIVFDFIHDYLEQNKS